MSSENLRVFWKFGADTSTNQEGAIIPRLAYFSSQLATQERMGTENGLIVSGAVAVALAELGITYEEAQQNDDLTDQMLATSGNIDFYASWKRELRRVNLRAGELLVTHHEIDDPQEERTFLGNLRKYLTTPGWIPLINESGSTGDEETKKLVYGGDNDKLAVAVALKLGDVDVINFMTETKGVFDTQNKLMREIDESNIEEALRATTNGSYKGRKSRTSKGGMKSKVEAAWEASSKGIVAHIAHSTSDFQDVLDGETGTLFLPH